MPGEKSEMGDTLYQLREVGELARDLAKEVLQTEMDVLYGQLDVEESSGAKHFKLHSSLSIFKHSGLDERLLALLYENNPDVVLDVSFLSGNIGITNPETSIRLGLTASPSNFKPFTDHNIPSRDSVSAVQRAAYEYTNTFAFNDAAILVDWRNSMAILNAIDYFRSRDLIMKAT
jgi:hypothetical protein